MKTFKRRINYSTFIRNVLKNKSRHMGQTNFVALHGSGLFKTLKLSGKVF